MSISRLKLAPTLLLTIIVSLMAACGGGAGTTDSGGSSGGSGGTGGGGGNGGGGTGGGISQVQHVVIVAIETLDYADVVGSPSAPYFNSLISQGGLATNYFANVHPSIGNYFFMTTGEAVTIDDDFSGVVGID